MDNEDAEQEKSLAEDKAKATNNNQRKYSQRATKTPQKPEILDFELNAIIEPLRILLKVLVWDSLQRLTE